MPRVADLNSNLNSLYVERYRARHSAVWVFVTWNAGDTRRGMVRLTAQGTVEHDYSACAKSEIGEYAVQHALEGHR